MPTFSIKKINTNVVRVFKFSYPFSLRSYHIAWPDNVVLGAAQHATVLWTSMVNWSPWFNTCQKYHNIISLQHALCRFQYCEAAYRCWNRLSANCCWPPQNDNECHPPGLPNGWQRPGGDPAGVSFHEALSVA